MDDLVSRAHRRVGQVGGAAKVTVVRAALERLRDTADDAQAPWPDIQWTASTGERVILSKGEFNPLPLPSGKTVELKARLLVPESHLGVRLAGEPCQVTVDSIYPIELNLNGRSVIAHGEDNVAPGPTLNEVSPRLRGGDNGELHLKIHIPQQQTWLNWVYLKFSTPNLRLRFELLDLAWSRIALAAEMATTDQEQAHVVGASGHVPVDLQGLDNHALARLDRTLAEALASLEPSVRALRVHVIGHSHIDLNWLWTWKDTAAVIKRDFSAVLALMEEFPSMTFTHSQAATYDVIQHEAPELFGRLRKLIADGRWEVAALQWVESDLNMPSGEALAHQMVQGVAYARTELGLTPNVFLAPDAFGHSGNLPQLAVSAGAQCYYHERCNPGGHDPWPAYWWYGDDGTRLLTCSTPTYWGPVTAGGIAQAAIRAHRHGLRTGLFFHGVGNHGGGPTREGMSLLKQLQATGGFVEAVCSTLSKFAAAVSVQKLPEHHGELNTLFEGCYSTNARGKARNREAENLLTTAGTLAALAGLDERTSLSHAWRLVLFNQFHDILCGSSIHEVDAESANQLRVAKEIGAAIRDRALLHLESSSEGMVAVTNPLGWDREDIVLIPNLMGPKDMALVTSDGIATPGQVTAEGTLFAARVSGFGTTDYAIKASQANGPIPAIDEGPLTVDIETTWCTARIHRGSGAFISLVQRQDGKELVGFGTRRATDYLDSARLDLAINVLQVVEEGPHRMSAWHLDSVHAEHSLVDGGTAEVIELGPVRVVVRIRQNFRSSSIVRDVCLYSSIPRIDVVCTIDWQEIGSPETGVVDLKVASTIPLLSPEAWFEIPFGACQRHVSGQEVPALRWADVGDGTRGLAILNDGRYGHDVLGSRLRMTLVRSAYEPDPKADIGSHRLRYSLVPHLHDWRRAEIPRLAAAFNQALVATVGKVANASRNSWRPSISGDSTVVLSALKLAEDGRGLVARLQESGGYRSSAVIHGLPPGMRAWEATITEDQGQEVAVGVDGTVQLGFEPWQVRTLLMRLERGIGEGFSDVTESDRHLSSVPRF